MRSARRGNRARPSCRSTSRDEATREPLPRRRGMRRSRLRRSTIRDWSKVKPRQVGHHQVAGSGQVDLLLPVRDARRLQPLCRRVAHRRRRISNSGRATDARRLRASGRQTRATDRSRRLGSYEEWNGIDWSLVFPSQRAFDTVTIASDEERHNVMYLTRGSMPCWRKESADTADGQHSSQVKRLNR